MMTHYHYPERSILTVGVLRKLLERRPDDEQVVIDDLDGWYANVGKVIVPDDEHSEFQAVTLVPGVSYDPRQYP